MATTEEQLAKLIETRLIELSDLEIILLEANEIGLAAFPDRGEFMVDANFRCNHPELNQAIVQYWNQYGRWHTVIVHGDGGEDAYNLAKPYLDGEDENGFGSDLEKKLADATWVKEYAQKARASMIADVRSTMDGIIDFWNKTPEEQEED